MLFQILEKTPFSAQYFPSEPFRPIAEFQLQEAEYNLKLNKTHYYEHAVKAGDRFWYPREIAERIAEYWREKWSFAEYQLSTVVSTPNKGVESDVCPGNSEGTHEWYMGSAWVECAHCGTRRSR